MSHIVDRIIALLKRWSRYDEVEEARLLHRYGAVNIDELYVMIMMDRTATPTGLWEMRVKTLRARIIGKIIMIRRTHTILNRQADEELAKSYYTATVRQNLEAKRLAKYLELNKIPPI